MLDNALLEEIKKFPIDFWDFKRHDTRDNSHGIHFYPATMIYPISKSIIEIISKHEKIETFLDPFMGSGTTLVEAKLSGIPQIYGTDLNPLAELLSVVKTTQLSNSQIVEIQDIANKIKEKFQKQKNNIIGFDDFIRKEQHLDITAKSGWGNNANQYILEYCKQHNIPCNSFKNFVNIGYWFLPKVIFSLQIIKNEIRKVKDKQIRNFLLVTFSETVRLVSNTRNSEFKLFRKTPEQVATFDPNVEYEFDRILNHNISKIKKFCELLNDKNCDLHIELEDTRILKSVPNNSIDLVVTSPPYGDSRTTVAYGQYSRLALQWLDLDNIDDEEIIKLDSNLLGGKAYCNKAQWQLLNSRTLYDTLNKIADKDLMRANEVFSFYLDLDKCLYAISQKTKNGGYHFWVVGNRTVKLETLQTDQILIELAQKYNLEFVYNFGRNISNKVMPTRNSPTNKQGQTVGTMTKEHIVVLRKAS